MKNQKSINKKGVSIKAKTEYLSAEINLENHKYIEAEKNFLNILALNESRQEVNILLSRMYIQCNQFEKAKKILENMEKTNKNYIGPKISQLATVLLHEKNFEQAYLITEKAFRYNPIEKDFLKFTMAQSLMNLGYYEEAKKIFNSLKDSKITKSNAITNLIRIELMEKNIDNVIKLMKQMPTDTYSEQKNLLFLKYYLFKNFNIPLEKQVNTYEVKISNNQESVLLNELGSHIENAKKAKKGYFYDTIPPLKILEMVKENIDDYIAFQNKFTNIYIIDLEENIGKCLEEETNQVIVYTNLNSNKEIISIEPAKLEKKL